MATADTPHFTLDSHVTDITGTDEVQKAAYTADAGTFTLTFDGDTTAAIAYNATVATVQDAFDALASIEPGDVVVGGEAGAYTFTFSGGGWSDQNVPAITATSSLEKEEVAAEITMSTTTAGAGNAIKRGTAPLADAVELDEPLAGETPTAHRTANKASYGDA